MRMRTADSRKAMKTRLCCPRCRQDQLARIARRGFLRQRVLPFFGFYPWECAICRKEFLKRKRGAAYRKTRPTPAAGDPYTDNVPEIPGKR